MKIITQMIENAICIRKVYVPPMIFFEDIEDKEDILAGSIPGGGQNTEPSGGDDDPIRGGRGGRAKQGAFENENLFEFDEFSLDIPSE